MEMFAISPVLTSKSELAGLEVGLEEIAHTSPPSPFLDNFLLADNQPRNLLDHLSLSLPQQAELHQKWQIRTWKVGQELRP